MAHTNKSHASADYNLNNGEPDRWGAALKEHPALRVNLAHFGGMDNRSSWRSPICNMMTEYDGLYADIGDFDGITCEATRAAFLRDLQDWMHDNPSSPLLRRLMYGSDYFMSMLSEGYQQYEDDWIAAFTETFRREWRRLVGGNAADFLALRQGLQREVHKLANILDTLPRRLQPRAKAALHEVMYAETRKQARESITRFAGEYGAKYPKAVATLEKDAEVLLTFFDFPAEHWKHLRTSNVIESPFATVRLRQRVTKGAGSRTKGLLMAYKLLDMAQARWRRLDGAHLLPLVRAGITFVDGVQQTTKGRRPNAHAA
jgi:Transposase, Mutator family/Amidohydrolase